jgi:hypothetical protein
VNSKMLNAWFFEKKGAAEETLLLSELLNFSDE